jgi:hypothetical protein
MSLAELILAAIERFVQRMKELVDLPDLRDATGEFGRGVGLWETAGKRHTFGDLADHFKCNDIYSRTTGSWVVQQMLKDGLTDNARGRNGSGVVDLSNDGSDHDGVVRKLL